MYSPCNLPTSRGPYYRPQRRWPYYGVARAESETANSYSGTVSATVAVYRVLRTGSARASRLVVHACARGDHRILTINRLTLDYVFLNKYTLKMKRTHFFLFLLI